MLVKWAYDAQSCEKDESFLPFFIPFFWRNLGHVGWIMVSIHFEFSNNVLSHIYLGNYFIMIMSSYVKDYKKLGG